MDSDSRLVFAAKAARTFAYGALGVVLPISLAELGLGPGGVGLGLTLILAASAAFTLSIRRCAARWGGRRTLLGLAAAGGAGAVLLLLGTRPWLVVAAAMLANVAVGAGESGPFLTLEHVHLARTAARERLGSILSAYNFIGYAAAALGAAAVGRGLVGLRAGALLLLGAAAIQLVLYSGLRADAPAAAPRAAQESSPLIVRLAGLFALDSFAGGFVIQSMVLYWLRERFGFGMAELGKIAFVTQLFSGLSFLAAPTLSRRWGLVNTMVFSHLASDILLIGVGLAPTAWSAVGFLFTRHLLSQIDVPTRQTFLMLAVPDHDRETAAATTNASRTLAQCLGPAAAGSVLTLLPPCAPFVIGGGLKIVYDLLLFGSIRRLEPR